MSFPLLPSVHLHLLGEHSKRGQYCNKSHHWQYFCLLHDLMHIYYIFVEHCYICLLRQYKSGNNTATACSIMAVFLLF